MGAERAPVEHATPAPGQAPAVHGAHRADAHCRPALSRHPDDPSTVRPLRGVIGNRAVRRLLGRLGNDVSPREAEREADAFADAVAAPGSGAAGPTPLSAPTPVGAPAVRDAVAGGGRAIDALTRARLELAGLEGLERVRIHTDDVAAASARALNARAYAVGDDIVFSANAYRPETADGLRLLAHEVAHTMQQRARELAVQCNGYPDPAVATDPDRTVEPPAGELAVDVSPLDLAELGGLPEFSYRVDTKAPDLILVSGSATREEIAALLFGDAANAQDFDIIDAPAGVARTTDGVTERAVRPRTMRYLAGEAATAMRGALDAELRRDVDAVVAELSGRSSNEMKLVEWTFVWGSRSNLSDAAGRGYFSRFLDELRGRRLVQPHWYTLTLTETTHTALEWLIIEAGSGGERIKKMITLRAPEFDVGYTVEDAAPELARGDVVGRGFFPSGGDIQLIVYFTIANAPTPEAAELTTRNHPWQGLRMLLPGSDGRYYGYALVTPNYDPLLAPPEIEGRLFAYYPGARFIRPLESNPDFVAGDDALASQRRAVLVERFVAMTSGDDQALAGITALDFDVLSQASLDERIRMFEVIAGSKAAGKQEGLGFLTRLVLGVPAEEFPAFERRLSRSGALARLAGKDPSYLSTLGRAYTLKVLSTKPVGGAALDSLPTIRVGKDASGRYHYASAGPRRVRSRTVEAGELGLEEAPTIGREPAAPGEQPEEFERESIVLVPGSHEPGIFTESPRVGAEMGPFLPCQLVRLEMEGDPPETRIVTALEASAIVESPIKNMLIQQFVDLFSAYMLYRAGAGLTRAMGPAFFRGLAAGGLRAGGRAVIAEATTEAGRRLVKRAVVDTLLIVTTQQVERHREELQRTPEGRAFLALWEVASAALLARDLYRLLSSGVIQRLATRAWSAAATATAAGVERVAENLEALRRAWNRGLQTGLVVETVGPTGVRTLRPTSDESFSSLFFRAQAEVASERLVAKLGRAGVGSAAATQRVEFLAKLAQAGDEFAVAYRDIARRAARMSPAKADEYLAAIEAIARNRRAGAELIAPFLRASANATDPAKFVQVLTALSARPISNEAVNVLGRRAVARTPGVDLDWLSKTSLPDDTLDFLARDSRTPWNAFKSAAAEGTEAAMRWARASLRGAAAEMVTQRMARRLFPGWRVSGRQVRMGTSELDFQVTATDRTGRTRAVEVKGWTANTWDDAMSAMEQRFAHRAMSEEARRAIRKIEHMLEQLQNAKNASRGANPYLVVTDALSDAQRRRLRVILRREVGLVEVHYIPDAQIKALAADTGVAMGIPRP